MCLKRGVRVLQHVCVCVSVCVLVYVCVLVCVCAAPAVIAATLGSFWTLKYPRDLSVLSLPLNTLPHTQSLHTHIQSHTHTRAYTDCPFSEK